MSSSAGSSSGPSHSLSPTTTPLVDHRYQLEQDGSGYSLRELQSGREIWHTSAFFRTKEVVKQLESSQNVDLDIVDSQPMVNKPRNTESKEEPLVNHLMPNTWAYAPGRGKPFISLTGIESTRLQSIPFPRSMVYAFFPSSTGVPAPTPSKSSMMNSVDLDKRVKFTTWMYNNHLKKYGFSLPSLPSDLEQAMMSAGPISPQPHTRHLHPTHSTTPNPPNGPSAFPSTLSSSPSPTPSSEFTAYLFAAWINDKAQQAPVSIPHMSGSKMATFAFKDKEPLVECVFLGAFLYTLAPPETKESPSPPPLSNAVTVSFDDGTGNNLTFTPPQGGRSLTSPAPGEDLNWKFTQSFGDDNSSDDDLVTAMAFDHQGHFLAVGDKAGRICIFEAHPPVHTPSGCDYVDFKFYTEFQSHGPEFDCLKSLEIEERISMLRWLKQPTSGGRFLLSTNDKTIKLWKVHEKKFYELSNPTQASSLALPPVPASRLIRTASCKRVFGNAHQYHINSISINSDGQTFISADDLRVYLWHLEDNKECFNVIDVKPPDLQELNEVITTVTFHPFQCNSLMYGTSRGNIRLVDFRSNAICDRYTRQFHYDNANPPPQEQSFFSEIISSISDCKFTDDGRFIISRDYLTLKIWDIRNEQRPLSIVPVHDYLQPYLSDLYENDCIFDKFQCHANHAGTRYLTGSYNNNFLIYDAVRGSVCTIEAKDTEPSGPQPQNETPDVEMMDFAKKSLHLSWHPSEEVIAVAGMNKIYIYQAALQRPHL